jgi:hypothetical protein
MAQWYSQPMYMDFFGAGPQLRPLEAAVTLRLLQTPMFVVYSSKSEESGVVHTSLRSLWEASQDVRDTMVQV